MGIHLHLGKQIISEDDFLCLKSFDFCHGHWANGSFLDEERRERACSEQRLCGVLSREQMSSRSRESRGLAFSPM